MTDGCSIGFNSKRHQIVGRQENWSGLAANSNLLNIGKERGWDSGTSRVKTEREKTRGEERERENRKETEGMVD